jgi:hypothetical protein
MLARIPDCRLSCVGSRQHRAAWQIPFVSCQSTTTDSPSPPLRVLGVKHLRNLTDSVANEEEKIMNNDKTVREMSQAIRFWRAVAAVRQEASQFTDYRLRASVRSFVVYNAGNADFRANAGWPGRRRRPPEALQLPRSRSGVDNDSRRSRTATLPGSTARAQQRRGARYEILHSRNSIRHKLHGTISTSRSITPSGGSTEEFRNGEFQIEQIGIGGDFHWQNVRGRVYVHGWPVRGHHAAQRRQFGHRQWPGNTGGVGQWDLQTRTSTCRKRTAGITSTCSMG